MQNLQQIYTLEEISNWVIRDDAGDFKTNVELPKVQRGFVWKAFQIEDLWDSLLRRYPIGSFVFNKCGSNRLQLLDGQQRATAITLGFDNKTFRGSEQYFKIFIDLETPIKDPRKYFIRVITDSHPWGYQRKSNNKPLEAQQKREAIKCWDDADLIIPDLEVCFPYDATLPVPLSLFLDAAINKNSTTELIDSVFNWTLLDKVRFKLSEYVHTNQNRINPGSEILKLNFEEAYIKEKIGVIYEDIIRMLNHHRIPSLYLDNVLEDNGTPDDAPIQESKDMDDQDHEVENLFVRLNSGGTPLRGEELNYSILKSKIDKKTQRVIEDGCEYFISPARFITVAFRLFQHLRSKDSVRDALGMNIKPKQFQGRLNSQVEISEFEKFILSVFEENKYDGKNLINYTKLILDYNPVHNPAGLPHLIIKKLVNSAPELLFMLWYRIMVKNDRFTVLSASKVHRKMLGMLTLFHWLGKGDNNRDYSKLLHNIWPAVKELDQDLFWSSATVKRAMQNNILKPIPTFKKSTIKNPGFRWFTKQRTTLKSALFDKYDKITQTAFNAEILLFNNELVLYAQREFLYQIFHSKQYYLDDTNTPFDWDHIYPHKFIAGKKNVPKLIKEFYNSIGNYRAWPYELNRMDCDDVPSVKFNPIVGSATNEELTASWQRFIKKYPSLISQLSEIPKNLLVWSKCDSDWAESNETDIKRHGKDICQLIINRAVKIIGIWYQELYIEDLIPEVKRGKSSYIQNSFYANKMVVSPAWLNKDDWGLEEYFNLILNKPIKVDNACLYIYFTFLKDPDSLLNENEIFFGLYDRNKSGFFEKIKSSDDTQYEINKEQHYIQGEFTLVSEHDQSLQLLFRNISLWIKNKKFPVKSIRRQLSSTVMDAIKRNYKPIFES